MTQLFKKKSLCNSYFNIHATQNNYNAKVIPNKIYSLLVTAPFTVLGRRWGGGGGKEGNRLVRKGLKGEVDLKQTCLPTPPPPPPFCLPRLNTAAIPKKITICQGLVNYKSYSS